MNVDGELLLVRVVSTFICHDAETMATSNIVTYLTKNMHDVSDLLKEVVTKWVTMRGFSLAATWMEAFKKQEASTTRKVFIQKRIYEKI